MEKISTNVIEEVVYQLLANTGTKYPKNYLEKLVAHFKKETNSGAKSVLASILQNIVYAVEEQASLCQDTGVPVFHVYLNPDISIEGDIVIHFDEPIKRELVKLFKKRYISKEEYLELKE